MEKTVEVQDRITLALSKKEALRRARDRIDDYGNELLQYSIKWKDLDDLFDSIAEDLIERVRIVEARENAVAERIRVVERQESELRSIQLTVEQNSRAKEEKLQFLESRLESCEMKIKEKEKELWSVQQMVEESGRDFRREDEKLEFLMYRIEFCDQEISKKEEQLGIMEEKLHKYEVDCRRKEEELISLTVAAEKTDPEIQEKKKELQFCDLEISKKEEQLGIMEEKLHKCEIDCSKKEEELISLTVAAEKTDSEIQEKKKELQSLKNSVRELHGTFVFKKKEMEAKFDLDFASKTKDLDSLQVKIDEQSRELSSLENSVADYSKRLDSKRIELDLITKRAAEFSEREKQSQQQQLKELRQQSTVPVVFPAPRNDSYPDCAISCNGTQIKVEKPDFPTQQQIFPQYTAATSYRFPISDNQIQSQMIRGELAHLNIDIDVAKLTLDEIDASYGQQLIREENGFDGEAMKTHIKLLEQITTSSTPIMPQVKQRAMDLAAKWVWKLRTQSSVDYLEVLGFFNFLAAYQLGSLLNQSEILRYIEKYSLRDKAPQLCQYILHSGYVIPSPKDLVQQKGKKQRVAW